MSKEHVWEEVSRMHIKGENATLVNCVTVPGGWMYVHTFMKFHTFSRDEMSHLDGLCARAEARDLTITAESPCSPY